VLEVVVVCFEIVLNVSSKHHFA